MESPIIKRHKFPKLSIIPADKTPQPPVQTSETYTVKSGDTIQAIVVKFYGSYDVSKIEKIKIANNLSDPNAIGIGQKLVIPMD